MNTEKLVKQFVDAMKSQKESTSAYDTTATVKRIDGDTAWVHIAGGVDETPIKKTINAKAGDAVQVRVGGGSAWIVGNQSAPPTDDAKAIEVHNEVKETNIVVKAVKAIAEQAQKIAGNTNQYFWHKESGTDTGVHITEVPQDEWNDSSDPNYHSGGNLLARSNGIALRNGMKELATLGQSGLDVNTYDGNGNTVNIAHLGYGPGTNSGGGTSNAPYYTLGTRLANSTVGNYSTAEGINVTSSGAFCHAEGSSTTASGMSSHAEGMNTQAVGGHSHAQGMHTIAQGLGQTVIGMYNAVQGNPQVLDYSDYAFIIGNGFDDNSRSNAFTIDWYGKISTPQIQGGTSACPSIPANSYVDVTVTFTQAFSSVPLVICCLGSTSTAGAIGSLSVAVYSTTVSSVTFRVFNAGASSRQPSIRWFGINI